MTDTPDANILADLRPEVLVAAYAQGCFPMVEQGRLLWFSPDPRGLLPLDERFHVPRRLARTLRSGRFEVTIDRAFPAVLAGCADRGEEGTWLSVEMRAAYTRLHELGLARSFETWPAGRAGQGAPIGGLYGVTIGGAFFGESMFHTVTDAGKAALVASVRHLADRGFALYDIQWTTPNLLRYGAYELPRAEYLRQLADAIGRRPA
jgi:leucyl/phenylalanyl-tRNA--protein transferase